MTNGFSATPPADQPPTSTNVPPAAQGHADRWDWVRAAAFFCVAVFLLSLIPTVLYGWYRESLITNRYLYFHQAQSIQIFFIGDLILPAMLLIAGSTLLDRSFWGTGGQSRLGASGRLILALGVIGAVAGLAVTFSSRIYQALQPAPSANYDFGGQLRSLGAGWMLTGIENGLVLGVALAFVFRWLSQRAGRAWLVRLLGAALLAGGILGLFTHLQTLFLWATQAWTLYAQEPRHTFSCAGGTGMGCFPPEAQTWLVAAVLPVVVALLLGALIGAPLAYSYGARDAHAREAMGEAADVPAPFQQAQGGRSVWQALGIGVGSFAAGILATGTQLYALSQLFSVNGPRRQTLYGPLIAVQLAPFSILALICAIRLMRMPRELHPSVWGLRMLALVSVLGLLPILVSQVFPLSVGPFGPPGMLVLADSSYAFAASFGALLALCWWPATAFSMRRVLAVALAGWLGFVLSLLLVAGYATYAIFNPSQATCRSLRCGGFEFALMWNAIEIGLITVFEGLPLMLVGVWMGSWLLERRGLRRAGD